MASLSLLFASFYFRLCRPPNPIIFPSWTNHFIGNNKVCVFLEIRFLCVRRSLNERRAAGESEKKREKRTFRHSTHFRMMFVPENSNLLANFIIHTFQRPKRQTPFHHNNHQRRRHRHTTLLTTHDENGRKRKKVEKRNNSHNFYLIYLLSPNLILLLPPPSHLSTFTTRIRFVFDTLFLTGWESQKKSPTHVFNILSRTL